LVLKNFNYIKKRINSGIEKKILKSISEIAIYCIKNFPMDDSQFFEFSEPFVWLWM
jgi:hypothetical protein